jgi:hypothetical protein
MPLGRLEQNTGKIVNKGLGPPVQTKNRRSASRTARRIDWGNALLVLVWQTIVWLIAWLFMFECISKFPFGLVVTLL